MTTSFKQRVGGRSIGVSGVSSHKFNGPCGAPRVIAEARGSAAREIMNWFGRRRASRPASKNTKSSQFCGVLALEAVLHFVLWSLYALIVGPALRPGFGLTDFGSRAH